ncbi:hypothetical protein GTY81_19515 [Streptomyces sp. SID8366]|uniref:hypothetical protein n=1 Tax=unclassified Streptomyces TaxID=2593676 RepID=UPI000DB9307D|nr:hypothetical protein [Streptomyces sp. PsTaAH-130]MYU06031.1 hypothetical protein [Streptomyces sp. SID8366]MYU67462.1 hypothetical protein [Streptomyces sp. SID69]RAJ64094.1 hypothetical protein K376_01190 [Streptomyces sp. PsTaAH-130]
MPTAGFSTAPAHVTASAPAPGQGHRSDRDEPLALAEVLDLQEAEVPHTADAIHHFFGDI